MTSVCCSYPRHLLAAKDARWLNEQHANNYCQRDNQFEFIAHNEGAEQVLQYANEKAPKNRASVTRRPPSADGPGMEQAASVQFPSAKSADVPLTRYAVCKKNIIPGRTWQESIVSDP